MGRKLTWLTAGVKAVSGGTTGVLGQSQPKVDEFDCFRSQQKRKEFAMGGRKPRGVLNDKVGKPWCMYW